MMSSKQKKRLPLIMSFLNMDIYSELVKQFQTKLALSNSEASFRLVIKNFFAKRMLFCKCALSNIFSFQLLIFFPDEDGLN